MSTTVVVDFLDVAPVAVTAVTPKRSVVGTGTAPLNAPLGPAVTVSGGLPPTLRATASPGANPEPVTPTVEPGTTQYAPVVARCGDEGRYSTVKLVRVALGIDE